MAVDWRELMIPQRTMRPSIAGGAGELLDPRCSQKTQHGSYRSLFSLHPVAHKLMYKN